MPIRILHVVEALGIGGGVENGIANLIRHMDHDRFEHILCAVFRLGPQLERYPAERVRLLCLDQKAKKRSVQVGPLAHAIRELSPDVVHSRNWGAMEAVMAGRWVRHCSVVHSEHGIETNQSAEPRRRNWFRRAAFELADCVFSVSEQMRDSLARTTGFPVSEIGVIHNGVDRQRFKPDPCARLRFRADQGIGDNEFVIGCVGRLNRIKDYPTVLRAAEVFSRSCPAWRLYIAGDGADQASLEAFVKASPVLNGRVHFCGLSGCVPNFLNGMDVYVLPSLFEGISNSLLEAMAVGLPVIASGTGGNPEVVVDGESGLLFPVGDFTRLAELLLRVQGDHELRIGLGQAALQRVTEEFSLDAMIGNYEQMYRELAGGRK